MKRTTRFYLLVLLLLVSLTISACAGALDAQGLNFNDLTGSQTLTIKSVHTLEPTEIHTTGTPEIKEQGTGEPTEIPETEVPGTDQSRACKTPVAPGSPGSNNSHEVLGIVTSVGTDSSNNLSSISVGGVTYQVTGTSVIHDKVQANDTVRLTFRYDSNCMPVVNEVKATDQNGSSDGQGNHNNGNSHEGGIHENGTPEPGSGGDNGGGG